MPQPRKRPTRLQLERERQARLDRLEAAQGWMPLLLRAGAFFMGAAILFWQMVAEHLDRPYMIAAGVGLVTGSAASAVGSSLGRALRGAADALDKEG